MKYTAAAVAAVAAAAITATAETGSQDIVAHIQTTAELVPQDCCSCIAGLPDEIVPANTLRGITRLSIVDLRLSSCTMQSQYFEVQHPSESA